MGNLQPIIDAILSDGEKKANAVKAASDVNIKAVYSNFEAEKAAMRTEFEEKLNKEIEQLFSAQEAERKQLLKTTRLKARTAAVKSSLKTAARQIAELDATEYSAFLRSLYEKTGRTGGIIFLNSRDKSRIDETIFSGSTISDKTVNTTGGFIMECGEISYDCTLEGIFEERAAEIYDTASEILAEVQI